jgi:cellulose biosynthesis protein BcsQ
MAAFVPPDDVSALMTRVELDHSRYKVFERRQGNRTESGGPVPVVQSGSKSPHRVPAREVQPPIQDASRPRWNVLNSLLSVNNNEQADAVKELLVPMLSFSGGSGGVGKTTILSTVSRVLSGMGESIFLVYSDTQRSLPLHFGRHQVVSGRVRTLVPPGRDFGHLHLYSRAQDESGVQDPVGSWLPEQVNELASEVGRVFCEVSGSEFPESQVLDLTSVNLRILVPDISSVLTVNRDLAEMDEKAGAAPTYYLLNKYDHALPFHRDVRERLSIALGERLLPFTIRRTDQIPEALAAGLTVADYAPNAPVIEDFKRLGEWIRKAMQRNETVPVRRIL